MAGYVGRLRGTVGVCDFVRDSGVQNWDALGAYTVGEVFTVFFEEGPVIKPHAVDTDPVASAAYWQYS
jgi:hypothetical protein